MKLKRMLMIVFLILTLIPTSIISVLLYKSGLNLSKESYMRNLTESINVQEDYISQTIENDMIYDYRFSKEITDFSRPNDFVEKSEMLKAFQTYLKNSQDKITVCILVDKNKKPVYTIGEGAIVDQIVSQLDNINESKEQSLREFELGDQAYSLGISTSIKDDNGKSAGTLISIYDKSYLFKITSTYYKITDTQGYICREDGTIVSERAGLTASEKTAIEEEIRNGKSNKGGHIELDMEDKEMSGYYKNIHNSTWYLVGVFDNSLIHAFANKFIWAYALVILGILVVDIILALYFSRKVVKPINRLITIMDDYQNNRNRSQDEYGQDSGYYETRYLQSKFFTLMNSVKLFQHNFEGIFQLYQSSDMGDINIEIDVKAQTISCNKKEFEELMEGLVIPSEACVVERFTRCFCDKDQIALMGMFEKMRDEHLSITKEAKVYTNYLGEHWFHIVVVPMYEDDRLSELFIQLRDITDIKVQELQSNEQARTDALTGLYNRLGFIECVNNTIEAQTDNTTNALMFIDMDYFKRVNDTFGHSAGDALLCSIGKVLLNAVGNKGIVSRFGGDEFVIFVSQTTEDESEVIEKRVTEALNFPFCSESGDFTVTGSVGVAVWNTKDQIALEALLQQADNAMYEVKRELKLSNKK